MKKNGFTLTEVLVALGIVGVAAALTIPALSDNVSKRRIGPSLAKAINTLENANAAILTKNQTTRLDRVPGGYFDALDNQLNGVREYAVEPRYYALDGTEVIISGNYYIYTTKDGVSYYIAESTLSQSGTPSGYSGKYYIGLIDINGKASKPNTSSKDIFTVFIDANGTVIPSGGTDYAKYAKTNVKWETYCNDTIYKGTSFADGSHSCTGAIADNGFKVMYHYPAKFEAPPPPPSVEPSETSLPSANTEYCSYANWVKYGHC